MNRILLLNMVQMREKASSNRKEIKRFAKFAIVGAAGSVSDFAVLNLLIQGAGFTIASANIFSFLTAVVQNFFLNRLWTFPESRGRNARNQLTQFALVSLVGFALNQGVLLTVHGLLEPWWINFFESTTTGFTVSYNFAKLFAIGIVLFWNFFVNRIWTYRGL